MRDLSSFRVRLLESTRIFKNRKKLQLVGMTSMLACKYGEVSIPIMEDFVLISDKAYTRKEVLDMIALVQPSI
ncbi:hypothetical protein Q3G72_022178 [Acer saccharum]|nr:hypothetical protein Q3G72_022178 [Acer saccharum]